MMNAQEWKTVRITLIAIAIFIVGGVFGASTGAQPQTMTKVETKTVKVPDTSKVQQLDAIDQRIIADATQIIQAQTTAIQVAAAIIGSGSVTNADLVQANSTVAQQKAAIDAANAKLQVDIAARKQLLAQ